MHNCLLLRDKELAICSPNFVLVGLGKIGKLFFAFQGDRYTKKCRVEVFFDRNHSHENKIL